MTPEQHHEERERLRAKYGADRPCENVVWFVETYDPLAQRWALSFIHRSRAACEAEIARLKHTVARVAEFKRTTWETPKIDAADGGA